MKLSFDYDGTLSKKAVQEYAKELVERGHEVYITTARWDSIDKYSAKDKQEWQITNLPEAHNELFEVADKIGIPRKNIHFTNRFPKYHYIERMNFLWHLDDDTIELMLMLINDLSTKGIAYTWCDADWKTQCEKHIRDGK